MAWVCVPRNLLDGRDEGVMEVSGGELRAQSAGGGKKRGERLWLSLSS